MIISEMRASVGVNELWDNLLIIAGKLDTWGAARTQTKPPKAPVSEIKFILMKKSIAVAPHRSHYIP